MINLNKAVLINDKLTVTVSYEIKEDHVYLKGSGFSTKKYKIKNIKAWIEDNIIIGLTYVLTVIGH